MLRLVIIVLMAWFEVCSAQADTTIRLANEIEVVLPNGWYVVSDSTGFPFQLLREDPASEVLISRTELSSNDAIHSPEDMKASIDVVISDVINDLPGATLLTSTGYTDSARARFLLEFLTDGPTSRIRLRHRFLGIIYRRPEGDQLLFTLWGKATADHFSEVLEQIKAIEESFRFTGAHSRKVFVSDAYSRWLLPLILASVLAAFWIAMQRRLRQRRAAASKRANHWLCRCGQDNSLEHTSCRRCGRSQPVTPPAGLDSSRRVQN